MADTSLLNVRIKHKFDTYAKWMASSLVLGAGEIAVAQISSSTSNSGLTPPTIGVKIGDGTHTFSQLNWIQSIAGDVHAWAKKENLAWDDLSEEFLQKLSEFANNEVPDDTNTTYQFSSSNNVLTVKSKEKGSETLTTVATLTLTDPNKISKVSNPKEGNLPKLAADGSLVDSGEKIGDYLKSATAANTYATKTELGTLEETVSGINTRVGTAEGKITNLQSAVNTLNGDANTTGSVKKQVADAIAGVVANAPADFDTLKEIADYIASDKTNAADINNTLSDHGNRITALEEVALQDTADIPLLSSITQANVNAWNAAEGNAKKYTDGKIATEAAAREALANRVTTIESDLNTATTGIKAVQAEHTSQIAALEEKAHTHSNKTVLDGITSAKVTQWDSALQAGNGITATTSSGKQVVSGVSTDLLKTGSNTLVLECGTSA